MKIGLLGAGEIGTTLAMKLGAAGHDVAIANSRGPGTIPPRALSTSARAVRAADVTHNVDVLIVSVPLNRAPQVAPIVATTPAGATIIDTGNYYPMRDGRIDALEAGQVESLWVTDHYGRLVSKAWNAITSQSLETEGRPADTAGRIAIPIAADADHDREVTMRLVEETGFDAYDAGSLANSWRQQPGTPAYCTDLTLEELPAALASADRSVAGERRDTVNRALIARLDAGLAIDRAFIVELNRKTYLQPR